jgi:hypothetical protein
MSERALLETWFRRYRWDVIRRLPFDATAPRTTSDPEAGGSDGRIGEQLGAGAGERGRAGLDETPAVGGWRGRTGFRPTSRMVRRSAISRP